MKIKNYFPVIPSAIFLLFNYWSQSVYSVEHWSGFRGPRGENIVTNQVELPAEFGPEKNMAWRREVPPGHSSPVMWADKIFLTGANPKERELQVLCLSAKDGSVLWRNVFRVDKLEKLHRMSSYASSTPATDGERVVSYFGSFGLICHDFSGKEVWRYVMPVYDTLNGSGTSPLLVDGMVILNREDSVEQVLIALDLKTGKEKWKFKHPNSTPNEMGVASTPVPWKDSIILHRSGSISAHSPENGSVEWFLAAPTTGCSTPSIAGNRLVFFAWNHTGEAAQLPPLPSFDSLLEKHDMGKDGKLSREEFPDIPVAVRPEIGTDLGGNLPLKLAWRMFDSNKDDQIDAGEYRKGMELVAEHVNGSKHGIIGVDLDTGSNTKTIAWKAERGVPEVPSPLVYEGRVYAIRNGGLLKCIELSSGKELYDERLGVSGPYFASPLAAGGHIFVASGQGTVIALAPGPTLQIVSKNPLNEQIFASPVVAGDKLLIRTERTLFAFGK